MQAATHDLDYLAARLHGRRSRLAEASRLDELCRLRTIPDLERALYPEKEFQNALELQRQLVQDLVGELSELLPHVGGAGARLLTWMLVRFEVENLKVLLRGITAQTPPELRQRYLVPVPGGLALAWEALTRANSVAEFIRPLPEGPLRKSLEEVVSSGQAPPRLFFLESALDRGYFGELLTRAERISGEDRDVVEALVCQEVDIFHFMLVVRGKFYYGLASELLLPFHLEETEISRARFITMLSDPDLLAAAQRAVGRVVDTLPLEWKESSGNSASFEPAVLEALAWNRYLQLANRAFRQSHIGLGAVVSYLGIRRVEVGNLLTLSEGIRAGLAPEAIRRRLIPRTGTEALHV